MAIKSYALTTAQRIADYAGLGTLSGSELTLMEAIVDSLTEFVEGYCARRFKQTTYTQEEYNTERAQTLNLNQFPIASSETFLLERRTSDLNEDDWEAVDSQYYHVDYDSGIIRTAGGIFLAATTRGYRVTYTAGYDYDNSSTYLSDTEAGAVELAIWMLGEAVWNKRKGGAGIQSERIGDYSVTYRKILMENEDIKAVLDKYIKEDEVTVVTPYQD